MKPRESALPALPLGTYLGAAAALAANRALDPGHQALVRVEPPLVGRAPAADRLVVDREGSGPRGELGPVLGEDLRVDRPEPLLRKEVLRGVRLREPDEPLHEILVRAR